MPIPTPSSDDFRTAALWLDSNEGDDDERAPLIRVARWLEQQAESKELREAAKEHGIPVGKLRAALSTAT
ncbi:TPA: hypothetical protein NHR53_006222 [Pseudomonas aeruginosa]|uniref:hypothetical protein n=1 Tax=Pseudomonas aeruginosa TaxID=287 RepID=UPI0011128EF3|nr:hypothetical protein [Pseudomonas aeruginosa]HCE7248320.1 hypothetical protein [Pseudomonas aeruginosa]HCE8129624.1 hypothetical protein [Pseudomonas aeruginosa]HCF0447760.1 hypothetical protein [Pseudomonas aeruginosa]